MLLLQQRQRRCCLGALLLTPLAAALLCTCVHEWRIAVWDPASEETLIEGLNQLALLLHSVTVEQPLEASPGLQAQDLPRLGEDLASLEALQREVPLSRTLLLLGLSSVLSPAWRARFSLFYLSPHEEFLALVFQAGCLGIRLNSSSQLPFADFAFDLVMVGSGWCQGACGEQQQDEWLRVLRPLGRLLLLSSTDAGAAALHPLARPAGYRNLFLRTAHAAAGLPVRAGCLRNHIPRDGLLGAGSLRERGQAHVPPSYRPLDSAGQRARLLQVAQTVPLDELRLRYWRLGNVFQVDADLSWSWLERNLRTGSLGGWRWMRANYIGYPLFGGARTVPAFKISDGAVPLLLEWLRQGTARSILDAGAGSCTLDAILRQQKLAHRLAVAPVAAFGAYDCSQLRVCAERGSISFQWDWLHPLPFCTGCTFDVVFQDRGMQHVQPPADCGSLSAAACMQGQVDLVLDHFDAVLACCGRMLLRDVHNLTQEPLNWQEAAFDWVLRKHYTLEGHIPLEVMRGKQSRTFFNILVIHKTCGSSSSCATAEPLRPAFGAPQPGGSGGSERTPASAL